MLVVEVLGVGRFFANVAFRPRGPWTGADGALGTTGLTGISQHEDYETLIARLDAGGLSRIATGLDSLTNVASISQASLELVNTSLLHRELIAMNLENAAVRIRLGIGNALGYADLLSMFYGFVDSFTATLSTIALSLVAGAFRWHHDLSQLCGDYFVATPADNRNAAIPLIVGANTDVLCILVQGDAVGNLAFAIGTTETTIYLLEYGAPFPEDGAVNLGVTEGGVSYTARRVVSIDGISYLELSGLTRGSPLAHSANVDVTMYQPVYRYVIGYLCTVLLVRVAGVIVSDSAYTVRNLEVGARQFVTVLDFDTEPGGVVTCDCIGANVGNLELLTNGGFESGDDTGWTVSGGTFDVTADDAYEGVYKAEFTGGEASDETAVTTFPTTPGTQYIVSFAHRNEEVASLPLLDNPKFFDNFDGWTTDSITPGTIVRFNPRLAFVGSGYTVLTVSNVVTISAMAPTDYIELSLSQVLTGLTASDKYAFGAEWFPNYDRPGGVLLRERIGQVQVFESGVQVGTTNSDGFVPTINPTFFGDVVTFGNSVSFIPAGTEVTVRVRLFSERRADEDRPRTVSLLLTYLLYLDTSNVSLVDSAYLIGTTSDDDAYAAGRLGETVLWHTVSVPFDAIDDTAQITISSQYTSGAVAARSVWLDGFAVEQEGRNPVDVIRWIITHFVPGLGVHDDSFRLAKGQRAGWIFGGQFRTPGDSRQLLDRLAQQCACRRYEDGDGLCRLVPINYESAPVYGFGVSNIEANSVTLAPSSVDNIYTHFYVYYGHQAGTDRDNPGNYAGIAYATPDSRTSPEPLDVFCQAAFALYGREHRYNFFADAIQDLTSAHYLLGSLVQLYTVKRYLVTFGACDLAGVAALREGSLIQIDHPMIPDGQPVLLELLQVTTALDRIGLIITGQFARYAGDINEWEPPNVYQLGAGDITEWDYTDTITIGEGDINEWEP